jgi:hypothetical protein
MTCVVCHGSGTVAAARPAAGWVNENDPNRDYKLNVLRLHDERQKADPKYAAALQQAGYSAAGLYAQVVSQHRPVLCAKCHLSEALPGTGVAGVEPLTQAIHARHSQVVDPITNKRLDDTSNRAACYRCHPGAETKCLRGTMGNAVAPDGTMAMQCQSCHGNMAAVGRAGRTGWLDEPNCQSCHSGTAVKNGGQIRFASSFDATGRMRVPADPTFATTPNTPAPGFSLYRFSRGHGGLQCEACHGSTHAEYPSSHANDNVQSMKLQGHVGTMAECTACHTTTPQTVAGGPHGLHPVGQGWVQGHKDPGEHNLALCKNCHGANLRGTVLSRSFADRVLQTDFGTKVFWRGAQIGCYSCHLGPFDDHRNPNRAPVAANATLNTTANKAAALTLGATDADLNPLTLLIVSQPAHGTVALSGRLATYFPELGFVGADAFTFAAWDGSIDSNLGKVSVNVAPLLVRPAAFHMARMGLSMDATDDRLVLAWPASSAGVTLEVSEDLASGVWQPLEAAPEARDGQWVLELRREPGARFYRLRQGAR